MELNASNPAVSPVKPFILPQSPISRIGRVWDFVRECIFNEFGSCLRHTWYRTISWLKFGPSFLNPRTIISSNSSNQTAKVVLLLHGAGAHPSCFIPLAQKLHSEGIDHIYTADLNQTKDDPVPVGSVKSRMSEITKKYIKSGYRDVHFTLVGHSLGAICCLKYIWKTDEILKDAKISKFISLAGRLRYLSCRFSWFCEDVKEDIETSYEAFLSNPSKVPLYSIWGDRDAIVPKDSAMILSDEHREAVIKGWGHGGIVYSPEAHKQILAWIYTQTT